MRSCTICNIAKPDDQFAWKNTAKGTRQSRCHPCRRDAAKASYKIHKASVVSAVRQRGAAFLARVAEFKRTLKCECCGETETCCLDFHHLDPTTKEYSISELSRLSISWTRLQREIEKCAVVCSNCHRKIHAGVIVLHPR